MGRRNPRELVVRLGSAVITGGRAAACLGSTSSLSVDFVADDVVAVDDQLIVCVLRPLGHGLITLPLPTDTEYYMIACVAIFNCCAVSL